MPPPWNPKPKLRGAAILFRSLLYPRLLELHLLQNGCAHAVFIEEMNASNLKLPGAAESGCCLHQ